MLIAVVYVGVAAVCVLGMQRGLCQHISTVGWSSALGRAGNGSSDLSVGRLVSTTVTGMLEQRWGRTLVWVLTVISLSAAALRLANVQPRAATIVFIVLGGSSYALNLARLKRAKRLRRERAPGG